MRKIIILMLLVLMCFVLVEAKQHHRHYQHRRHHYHTRIIRPVYIIRDYGNRTFNVERSRNDVANFLLVNGVNKRLRVGQGSVHNRLSLVHLNAMDVGISPASEKGRKLIAFLRQKHIPFLAISGAKRGVSTGPHVHIGFPSPRMPNYFPVGTIDGKVNNVYYENSCFVWQRKLKIPLGCL